jgi:hypothetical protein
MDLQGTLYIFVRYPSLKRVTLVFTQLLLICKMQTICWVDGQSELYRVYELYRVFSGTRNVHYCVATNDAARSAVSGPRSTAGI